MPWGISSNHTPSVEIHFLHNIWNNIQLKMVDVHFRGIWNYIKQQKVLIIHNDDKVDMFYLFLCSEDNRAFAGYYTVVIVVGEYRILVSVFYERER